MSLVARWIALLASLISGTASLAAFAELASAQDITSQQFIPYGDEVLTLNLGGIVNRFGTTLRLDGSGINGSNINLENDGLKNTQSSFDAGGTWRFWSRNRIDVLYFSSSRSGNRTIDREIDLDGQVIPINSSLAIQARNQYLIADYRYSFVKHDETEFAGLLGFYGSQYKYHVSATNNSPGGGQYSILDATASTTVPLPLLGATLDWYINTRWKFSANAEGVKAKIASVNGSAFVGGVSTEYMLVRNVGVGLGYLYSDVSADVNKNSFNGNLGWKMNSVTAFAQFKF
jgi:opacity protein-like surface antigen